MGWIPRWGSLWMAFPSVSAPHFVSIFPPMSILFPLLRSTEASTLWFSHMLHYVHSSHIYNSQKWKKPRCPSTEEWIQKMWYIYTMKYYSAIKNNEFMKSLDKQMELENIILNEVTQSQKNTHGMHSLISGY